MKYVLNEHLNYEVTTESGVVRGTRCGDPNITVFRGVPYAQPPVGELRFAEPRPHEKWDGVRDCTQFAHAAIIPDMGDVFYQNEFHLYPIPSDEDCLYLNIWTPAKSAGEKLPVMFWIHGGGNFQGYSHEMEFDGEGLAKRGVILVTVGYRLSTLGFLAHPALSARNPHRVSGQFGMLDLVSALDWVRRNIEAFGGDPDCITVFGQSAGGADVVALLASPLTEGKFHRAVIMSGFLALEGWTAPTQAEADADGLAFCERRGITSDDLMTTDGRTLTDKFYFNDDGSRSKNSLNLMRSVADGYFLNEQPTAAFLSGHSHKIPVMIGTVFGDGSIMRNGDVSADEMIGMSAGAALAAATARDEQGMPIYTYFFDRNLPGNEECPPSRSYHSSDLWYVFGTIGRSTRPLVGRDFELANTAMDYWSSFAKNGDPNCSTQPEWKPYTAAEPLTMVFGDDASAMQNLTQNEHCVAHRDAMLDSFREGQSRK